MGLASKEFTRRRKIVVPVAGLLVFLPLLAVSLWSISFGFLAGYFGVIALSAGVFFLLKCPLFRIIPLTMAAWLVINLALIPDTIRTYNMKRTAYFDKVSKGQGLETIEKLNVFGLNVIMCLMALPVYPEAALESFLLIFPDRYRTRYFQGGFFLKSGVIRRALASRPRRSVIRIGWKTNDTAAGSPEARFALALNPCEIEIIGGPGGNRVLAKVSVKYPGRSETTLLEKPFEIRCEEGLFAYLQNTGWLHPYRAVWVAKECKR